MLHLLAVFILMRFVSANESDVSIYGNCKIMPHQSKFDVLPGRGWDNLMNKEMGRVLALNFSNCNYSQDNLYLLPNDVSIIPVKRSRVELFAESIDHFQNYTSMTSKSVNVNGEASYLGFGIGGSFSQEKTQIKNDQLETKSKFVRVQLRYLVYHSVANPDAELDPIFKNRILDIASLVIENKDALYPAYLADLIVRDFGTHVLQTVDAGAILSKTDALDSEYSKKYQGNSASMSASASASFNGVFGFKLSTSYTDKSSTENVNEFNKNTQKTHVETFGGTLFGANFSVTDWEKSVMKNLVTIDRNGDPIFFFVNPRVLPELDETTVHKVHELLKEAVHRYYVANVREGCMDFNSPNFNPDANVDSATCIPPEVNFTLGGVYQTCSGPWDQCSSVVQSNPLTREYSCPPQYDSLRITGGLNKCETKCHGWWIFSSCETQCSYYEMFWCFPRKQGTHENGYQFGGIISKEMSTCPLGYIPLKVGLSAQICVTNTLEPNDPNAIGFGGFYSCSAGNPIAKEYARATKTQLHSPAMVLQYYPKKCPKGYVAHILNIERGCQISYCTETNKGFYASHVVLNRPPFIKENFNPNSTKIFVFSNSQGEKFIKDNLGVWKFKDIQKKHNDVIIGSVVGSILTAVLISVIVFAVQRRYYRRKLHQADSTEPINDESHVNYGSIQNTEETV